MSRGTPHLDPGDLTGEEIQRTPLSREDLEAVVERKRGLLMVVFGVGVVVLIGLQMAMAVCMDPASYAPLSALLSGVTTLATGVLGAGALFYWTRLDV